LSAGRRGKPVNKKGERSLGKRQLVQIKRVNKKQNLKKNSSLGGRRREAFECLGEVVPGKKKRGPSGGGYHTSAVQGKRGNHTVPKPEEPIKRKKKTKGVYVQQGKCGPTEVRAYMKGKKEP